jgi:hypothetical protein
MIMEGFTSQLFSGSKAPCMNFLFTTWELNGAFKFGAACVGTFFLGMLLHLVTKVRQAVGRWKLSNTRTIYLSLLYGLNTGMGYMLMLLAMTYSTELFLMVLTGLTVGYGVFLVDRPAPVSTDPCCQEENEADKKCNSPLTHSLLVNTE